MIIQLAIFSIRLTDKRIELESKMSIIILQVSIGLRISSRVNHFKYGLLRVPQHSQQSIDKLTSYLGGIVNPSKEP